MFSFACRRLLHALLNGLSFWRIEKSLATVILVSEIADCAKSSAIVVGFLRGHSHPERVKVPRASISRSEAACDYDARASLVLPTRKCSINMNGITARWAGTAVGQLGLAASQFQNVTNRKNLTQRTYYNMITSSLRRLATVIPLAALISISAFAQKTTAMFPAISDSVGPFTDSFEFTLGGNGFANNDLNDSLGGLSVSIGKYVSDTLEYSIRQSVNYSNRQNAGKKFNGATFFAVDHHFGQTALRPFIGANVGGVYGGGVSDSFGAGLEGGAKYYIQPRAFVFGMLQYAWLFDKIDRFDDRFSQGSYIWNVGVGFRF